MIAELDTFYDELLEMIMNDFASLSNEEQDEILAMQEEHEREVEELRLLRDIYKKAVEMIGKECMGGKEYTRACINFKGAIQKMMIHNEETCV